MRINSGIVFSLALAVLLAPVAAKADSMAKKGFYGSFHGGYVDADDHNFQYSPGNDVSTELDGGFGIGAALGYDFGHFTQNLGVRAEAEITYRDNEVDGHDLNGAAQTGAAGDLTSLAFMANGIIDIHNKSRFTPYAGAGIGFANVEYDGYDIDAVNGVLSDDDTVFAYQLIAGLSFDINEKFALTADYRYFATEDPDVTTVVNNDTSTEYDTHNFLAGIRYKF